MRRMILACSVLLTLSTGATAGQIYKWVDAQGRTREYRLRLRLTFRVHDGKGNEFVPPGEIVVSRDIAFNEAQVLAREAEEALLLREMQTDAVQQMLRRIAAARPPVR